MDFRGEVEVGEGGGVRTGNQRNRWQNVEHRWHDKDRGLGFTSETMNEDKWRYQFDIRPTATKQALGSAFSSDRPFSAIINFLGREDVGGSPWGFLWKKKGKGVKRTRSCFLLNSGSWDPRTNNNHLHSCFSHIADKWRMIKSTFPLSSFFAVLLFRDPFFSRFFFFAILFFRDPFFPLSFFPSVLVFRYH